MISQVTGPVLDRTGDGVVLGVGGVGLNLVVTPRTAANLDVGCEYTLATELVVREDSLTLYGFAEVAEREMFATLQTVSGIGPRLAMTMVATLTPEQIRSAVAQEDVSVLTTVPGLGKKTAQRIILDLRDRLGGPTAETVALPGSQAGWRAQVIEALTGLGWSSAQAQEAAVEVARGPNGADLDVPAALRQALKILDRQSAVGR
jgi:Holliday junction DNA helicase RuvA